MKDLEFGSFEAKNQLSRLLGLAEKGQRIYITRRGRRVAMLTSVEDEPGEEAGKTDPAELLERFRSLRRAAKRGPESLRELIAEGRR